MHMIFHVYGRVYGITSSDFIPYGILGYTWSTVVDDIQ